ncbi:hypothetical protein WJX72_005941 [[Myrmecia] bisecta]|uniref:Uncharacterized protein n=1 Tax=[Myrmecia] bisecta TaxID=41462 RepID=A0AAW1PWY2_9CHLO
MSRTPSTYTTDGPVSSQPPHPPVPASSQAATQTQPHASATPDELPEDLKKGLPHTGKEVNEFSSNCDALARLSLHSNASRPAEWEAFAVVVEPYMLRAQEAEAKKFFKAAAKIYEQILKLMPNHKACLLRLISLWQTVQRPEVAADLARQAVGFYPNDAALHQRLGDCLRESGQNAEALQAYDMALQVAKQHPCAGVDEDTLQACMANVLYAMGDQYQNAAAAVVMSILERDQGHWEALYQYARIAMDRNLTADAISVFVRLLARRPDHTGVRLQLAQCLERPDGMQLLYGELSQGSEGHAALAFLATAVKDHGAVESAIALYRRAYQEQPTSPSYALNLMHTLELEQAYNEGLDIVAAFCKTTRVQLGGGLDLQKVAPELEGLPQLTGSIPFAWLDSEPWDPPGADEDGEASCHAERLASHAAAACSASKQPPEETAVEQVDYNAAQLDTLALLFTAVKLLYVGGALARCARLVELVDAARRASRRPLHTTLIRNEAAYFGCVSQLLQDLPPPHQPQLDTPMALYLCGDSHSLSGAWHIAHLRTETRVLVPLLVTGCKLWHLRKEGRFYPKMAFLNTMESLPDGAQVIFMFGEIDCREGLLLAVDKLKYSSIEEAMDVLVHIYCQLLLDLVQRRRFEVFVHPVPPVLNETRHVVKPFNEVLQAKITEISEQAAARGRIHWLDDFDDLLTPDGCKLNPKLQFDGTHMSPYYVNYLNRALTRVI